MLTPIYHRVSTVQRRLLELAAADRATRASAATQKELGDLSSELGMAIIDLNAIVHLMGIPSDGV